MTTDHVQRFGRRSPVGPTGGSAYPIPPASSEVSGSSKKAT